MPKDLTSGPRPDPTATTTREVARITEPPGGFSPSEGVPDRDETNPLPVDQPPGDHATDR